MERLAPLEVSRGVCASRLKHGGDSERLCDMPASDAWLGTPACSEGCLPVSPGIRDTHTFGI